MAKDKSKKAPNSTKHPLGGDLGDDYISLNAPNERPSKKAKLLDDSDVESDNDDGGVSLKINEEYAKRFEYNKKRDERFRCMSFTH